MTFVNIENNALKVDDELISKKASYQESRIKLHRYFVCRLGSSVELMGGG